MFYINVKSTYGDNFELKLVGESILCSKRKKNLTTIEVRGVYYKIMHVSVDQQPLELQAQYSRSAPSPIAASRR